MKDGNNKQLNREEKGIINLFLNQENFTFRKFVGPEKGRCY